MSKLYTVQAVIHGRIGAEQFKYAAYQAHEQLLDAGAGRATPNGHCILRNTTVIALSLLLEDGRDDGLSVEDEAELRVFEDGGYGERDFVLEYASGFFAGDEQNAVVLCLPEEIAAYGLDGEPQQQRAWHAVLTTPVAAVEPSASSWN